MKNYIRLRADCSKPSAMNQLKHTIVSGLHDMVAAAVVGSAVVGGVAQSSAASKAAKAQQNAANQANDTQMNMFNTTQANLQPYMQTGESANKALSTYSGLDENGNPLTSALLKPITMNRN